MSSDITQACISISITLDIGWWVIRCRHYCTTSSILGETQLSRLEHTAIVSTICYECHTQATKKPTATFQTFNRFRFADTLSCLDHVLEYCLGIHIQTMFKAGGILQCSSGGGWEGGHIAARSDLHLDTGAPQPRFYALLIYSSSATHTHTVAHSDTHTQWQYMEQARFMAPNWPAITPRLILRLPAPPIRPRICTICSSQGFQRGHSWTLTSTNDFIC